MVRAATLETHVFARTSVVGTASICVGAHEAHVRLYVYNPFASRQPGETEAVSDPSSVVKGLEGLGGSTSTILTSGPSRKLGVRKITLLTSLLPI